MKTQQIAAQIYTIREHLKTPQDIAASLKKVRAIGYHAVEVCCTGAVDDTELNRILDGEGLLCCSTHEAGATLLKSPGEIADRLDRLRCKNTVCSYSGQVDFNDEAAVTRFIEGLDRSGKILAERGKRFGYHNHGLEFQHLKGRPILELIYEQTNPRHVQAEIDTYWVQYGGGDPVEWCRRLKGRLPFLHMKDYGFSRENKPCFAEVGRGNLRWKEILAAAEAAGCEWFIVEQDICPGDPFDSLKLSYDYIQAQLVA